MSLSGAAQLFGSDQLTTTTSSTSQVGQLGVTVDGRAYRYCKAGEALVPGKLLVASPIVANHENMAVAAAAAVGAFQVTVTLGATEATVNQYAGGFLTINDATGEGISYLVSGHPAAALSTSLVVTLVDPIKVALTTSSEATLQKNPWDGVVISVTDQLDMPVGIPNVSVASGSFCWLQTRGLCAALADETLAIGVALTIGTGTAGAVEALDAAGEPQIGVAIQAGVDTEYRAVYLQID